MADEVQPQGESPKEHARSKFRSREHSKTCDRVRNARRNNKKDVPPKPATKPARVDTDTKSFSAIDTSKLSIKSKMILMLSLLRQKQSSPEVVEPPPLSPILLHEPQAGTLPGVSDSLTALKVLAATRGLNVPRKVMKLAEGLISLFFSLREANSKTQFVSILVLYLNGICENGVILTLSDYVHTLFSVDSQ